jgi:signal transduction histidine kinase
MTTFSLRLLLMLLCAGFMQGSPGTGTVIADIGCAARACRASHNGKASTVPVSSHPPTDVRAAAPLDTAGCPRTDAEFAAWLQRTREAERAALARELHDELGAILTAARLDVAWLAAQPACHEPVLAQRLEALRHVLALGIGLKRRIVEDLHPSVLTHFGLAPALEQLVASSRQRFDGRLAASIDASVALDGEPALALYRIAQEALTNLHKYAGATLVRVALRRVRGRIELSVEDDGRGFDAGAVGSGRHGLAGMRHRMLAVGGTLELRSTPGAGTTIRASVPAPSRAARADSDRRGTRVPATTARPARDAPDLRA